MKNNNQITSISMINPTNGNVITERFLDANDPQAIHAFHMEEFRKASEKIRINQDLINKACYKGLIRDDENRVCLSQLSAVLLPYDIHNIIVNNWIMNISTLKYIQDIERETNPDYIHMDISLYEDEDGMLDPAKMDILSFIDKSNIRCIAHHKDYQSFYGSSPIAIQFMRMHNLYACAYIDAFRSEQTIDEMVHNMIAALCIS